MAIRNIRAHNVAVTFVLLLPSSAYAQQVNEPCPNIDGAVWNNCIGSITTENGAVYTGNWIADNINGFGVFKFSSGNTYEGEFKDGKFEGFGTYTFSDGSKYVGLFHEDKFEELGTMTYQDGTSYTGYFKNDQRHGYGKVLSQSGEVVEEGVWEEDVLKTPMVVRGREPLGTSSDNTVIDSIESVSGNPFLSSEVPRCGDEKVMTFLREQADAAIPQMLGLYQTIMDASITYTHYRERRYDIENNVRYCAAQLTVTTRMKEGNGLNADKLRGMGNALGVDMMNSANEVTAEYSIQYTEDGTLFIEDVETDQQ